MADQCIFCREEVGLLQKRKLWCGNTVQILCGKCYKKYESLSAVERAEAALATGRAEDSTMLREYVERIRTIKKAKQEKIREEEANRVTDKTCLRCNGRMVDHGKLTFKLGEETYFMSDWNRLMSGSLEMNVLRCEDCGKTEFFIYDLEEIREARKNEQELG